MHTVHSLTQPATPSFIRPSILSFIYLLTYFIFAFNHLFTGPLVCSLSHSFNKQTLVRCSLERQPNSVFRGDTPVEVASKWAFEDEQELSSERGGRNAR